MGNLIHDSGANLSDLDAEKLIERAAKQEDAVMEIFEFCPEYYFSAWTIYHLFDEQYFIGSIRRAITNLERAGRLVKVPYIKELGDGGVWCRCWTLVGQKRLFTKNY